ncbi:G-protein coupled receptor moody-like [Mya arenaria]|uniref:G-protein coupled receptor moody-like n=1 Tax=Mya arenaria TaxID=6604 RepID=UPI0022E54F97|nr:G-protein coupled receptor moody-like [Mya arenaria]XP_052769761.1 G-protein coupled receptor moody-like [Mya arenaria]
MNKLMNDATSGDIYRITPNLDDGSSNETHCFEWWCFQHKALIVLEALTIILCLVGSFGNLVTILAILFSSLRYCVNCILIGSLSFAGFLYCSLVMSIQAVFFHRKSRTIPQIFCSATGGIRYTLSGVIMAHLAVIALYLFLNFVYIDKYRYMSKVRQLIISLLVCWVVPCFFTIPPTNGVWGAFQFQTQILSCTFDKSVDQSNRVVMVIAGFIIPCIFIMYCYVRIACTAYNNFKRVRRWQGNSPKSKAIRISTMMMCIFLIFFLSSLPNFVLNLRDKEFIHPIHHIWTTMFRWVVYCCNPAVYSLMDKNFRRAYKKILMRSSENKSVRRARGAQTTNV